METKNKVIPTVLIMLTIKIVEMVLIQQVIYRVFDSQQLIAYEELVDVVVLSLILTPLLYIFAKQKKTMKQAEEKYRILAEDSLIGIYMVNDNQVTYANQHFLEMTGYTEEELSGMSLASLVNPSDSVLIDDFYKKLLDGHIGSPKIEIRLLTKEKNMIDVEVYGKLTQLNGKLHIIGSVLNITDRKNNERLLEELAFKDPLTGLPNRRFLEDQFHDEVLRNEESATSAVFFMDLDGFKQVNDTWGHDIGDLVLMEVANRLLSCVGSQGLVSRLGGDEFILFFPGINRDDSINIVENILEVIQLPFDTPNGHIHLTTSIGMAFYQQDGTDLETLIKHADQAMYHAKRDGKNTYSC